MYILHLSISSKCVCRADMCEHCVCRSALLHDIESEQMQREWYSKQLEALADQIGSLPFNDDVSGYASHQFVSNSR